MHPHPTPTGCFFSAEAPDERQRIDVQMEMWSVEVQDGEGRKEKSILPVSFIHFFMFLC